MFSPYSGMVIGLGNPGPEYEWTRHNCGCLVLSALRQGARTCQQLASPVSAKLWRWQAVEGGTIWLLLQPLTYMNNSGQAVAPVCQAFGIDLDRLLVLHDDLDLPLFSLRLKRGGGLAGHRGLGSIASELQSQDFDRLRIGIGRPSKQIGIADHVLSPFSQPELNSLPVMLAQAIACIHVYSEQGLKAARTMCRA